MSDQKNDQSKPYVVKMQDIGKYFGGTRALMDFSMDIASGKVHALVGENGAGKSTAAKILSGAVQKDFGTIFIDGKQQDIGSPRKGRELGISIVYQESTLAPNLSVAENMFLGGLGFGHGLIDWKDLYRRAALSLKILGVDIDPRELVKNISVAYQKLIEIVKALSEKPRVLILDEPTAVLPQLEVEKLFNLLMRLKKTEVGIIYISNRLEEVFEIADFITVLRDGEVTGTFKKAETNIDQIINLMIGCGLQTYFPNRESRIGKVAMKVENYCSDRFRNISFEVRKGEVLGFAGLVGSGRTELARAIFGANKKQAGRLLIDGNEVTVDSPGAAIEYGIAMIPESRMIDGLIPDMSIKENISLANLGKITQFGFFKLKMEKKIVSQLMESLSLKTIPMDTAVCELSGGNQQKVVLAKWFNTDSKVVIFDEPTKGVDIGAKMDIYDQINKCSAEGIGVIMISSEIAELMGMCDRICVFSNGEIRKELSGADISEQNIIDIIMERRAS
ncbi:MAG: sugar ABC transporter ATP-binding protein [Treponema sp.]|nr:sugar ABC transporter ATP-binding protein [Treponema sp.]